MKGNFLNRIVLIAIAVAVVLLVLNSFMLFQRGVKVAEASEILEEELRPAEISVITVTQEDCESCFDIETVVDELGLQNVNITSEETVSSSSEEGKELVSRYNIEKLPTMLVSGEIDKSEQLVGYFEQRGDVSEGTFVYTSITPPYFDVLSQEVKGLVEIRYIIDSSCEECVDLTPISSTLTEQGLFIQDESFVEYDSQEGQELISTFDIKEVPAVLISEEVDYYPEIKDALLQSGASKKEGYYAVHSTLPPYRDLSEDTIVGLVDVVYLTKEDCSVCYDVSVNRDVLLRFGLVLDEEETLDVDSAEGEELVQKYGIEKVPIIVLSPDSGYYSSFVQVWESVGTVESDGWFVMRNPEVIGTYWDLELGEVVQAAN